MLIKALCDYSALQENKTPAGYCKQAIHFEILLTPEGKIAAINDLRVPRIAACDRSKNAAKLERYNLVNCSSSTSI